MVVRPALRAQHGGMYTTKTLYITVGETILALRRPVAICAIPDLSTRGDLLDQALVATLDAIDEGRRKLEDEIMAAYYETRPSILGALLDAVSGAMRRMRAVGAAPRVIAIR